MDNEYNYDRSEEEQGAGGVNFVLQPDPEHAEEKEEKQESGHPDPRPARPETKSVKKQKTKKRHAGLIKVAACVGLAILFGVVASATYQVSNYIADRFLGNQSYTQNKTAQVSTTKVNRSKSVITSDVTEIVKETMPSVVSITNMSVKEVQSFFGGVQLQESQSSGSGFIVGKNDSELLVVTNNHVVKNSKSLTVTFADNESVEGVVKGTDPSRDVAVVSVPLKSLKNSTLKSIAIAQIGDSKSLQVGEPAIAIGNALGYGQSVTTGIISATERELDGFEGKLIQTDAAINPGNSGGALLNANGEVIGINTVKINAEAVEGIGYAIPLSDISELLEHLMNKETRTIVDEDHRGYLGITGFDVTEESAEMYNMPIGVYVSEVVKGSGIEKAGVIKGSIITKFEGIGIKTMNELKEQLQYYKAGEKVKITLQMPANRGTFEEKTIEVKLMKYHE